MSDPFADLFMQFLKDKKTAVKGVVEDFERLNHLNKGLTIFLKNIDNDEISNEEIRKKVSTLVKVMKTQNNIMTKMMILLIAYINGSRFEQDVASLLSQSGHGEEALNAMMDSKLKGSE